MTRALQESIDKRNAAVMELEADYRNAIAALRGLVKWCDANINGVPQEYGLRMAAADEVLAKADKRVWPSTRTMTFEEAKAHAKSLGGELPSMKDFEKGK